MFIGYQNNKIVLTANTREELENTPCMTFDKIEETDINYTLYNGEYLTDAEVLVKQKEARKKELIAELTQIDLESIRPTRAIQNGTATEFDTQKLAELEERAEQIRQEIRDLSEVKLDKEEEFD